MDPKLDLLRQVPLFADLDDQSLSAISVLTRELTLPAGSVLLHEGAVADDFYLIVEGIVRVERDGRPVRSMTAGGFLGEIGLVEHAPRTATATCATDCRLLALSNFQFDRLLGRFPEIKRRVGTAMSRRPRGTGSRA